MNYKLELKAGLNIDICQESAMINRITRRGFLSIAGISVISFRFPEPTSATAEADNRPNLLFIMADDHTSQAWGCYGSRLAKFCPTELSGFPVPSSPFPPVKRASFA